MMTGKTDFGGVRFMGFGDRYAARIRFEGEGVGAEGGGTLLTGTDTVAGGAGQDTLAGADTVAGGADTVVGDAGQDTAKGEDTAPAGAPEKYEDFKLPEGVAVDAAAIEAFTPLAKELGLSQEAAQKLVDFQAAHLQAFKTAAAAEQEQAAAQWAETTTKWRDSATSDKEYGGDKLQASVAGMKAVTEKVLGAEGAKAFTEALDMSGLGNHPEVLRFLHRVAVASADDKLPLGEAPRQPKSTAEMMYPSMAPRKE
jgi:Ca2+-binding RTX toxin-like protein